MSSFLRLLIAVTSCVAMTIGLLCTLLSTPAAATPVAPKRPLVSPHPAAGPVLTYDPSLLRIKFRPAASIDFDGNDFLGGGAPALHAVLHKYGYSSPTRLISDDSTEIAAASKDLVRKGRAVPDLNSYYRVRLGEGANSAAAAKDLKQLPFVEDAYAEPRAVPPPASPDLSGYQTYKAPSPLGIGVTLASTWPGVDGAGVKVFDLEYSWNTSHEDLSALRGAGTLIPLGTPEDPFGDTNHGTAVLGILSGDGNGFGVTGTVNGISLHTVNTYTTRMWNPAGAVYTAVRNAAPGDIILLEQQAFGPSGDPSELLPIEWIPDVYDAIRFAVAKGVNVIEAGGNGGRNLNDPSYGDSFPAGKPDSGAILVGAGGAGSVCSEGQQSRSRLDFSNYGDRVNVQGWGECVASTGDGDAYDGGVNATYTRAFSGTSSAAPIVASAAASFVAAYKRLNGVVPTPAQVRSELIATGTPQSYLITYPGRIGPLVNVSWALKRTDLMPPTPPTGLAGARDGMGRPALSWSPGTDNVGVASYRVYRNDVPYRTLIGSTAFVDGGTDPSKSYRYRVHSVDRTDKYSSGSNTVTVGPVSPA